LAGCQRISAGVSAADDQMTGDLPLSRVNTPREARGCSGDGTDMEALLFASVRGAAGALLSTFDFCHAPVFHLRGMELKEIGFCPRPAICSSSLWVRGYRIAPLLLGLASVARA
jgi:hypothetical protein